ncbi:hypothetical protein [Francisella noatunensis]
MFLVASQINSSDEDFKTYKVYIGFRKSY